ncbi:hypothetical protein ACH4OW_15195 [Streptomyces sp. NPDC017056]|uniref:hypothetical protein n=1 Tax=Streptomyces sp. NPDC017056 TaxID=3364973 RepID=UPI0037B3D86F
MKHAWKATLAFTAVTAVFFGTAATTAHADDDPPPSAPAAKWEIKSDNGRCLDATPSPKEGVAVVTWNPCHESSAQLWGRGQGGAVGHEQYYLYDVPSLCVTRTSGSAGSGVYTLQKCDEDTEENRKGAQDFRHLPQGDANVGQIRNRRHGEYLKDNGHNVPISGVASSGNRWDFKKIV